MTNDETVRLFRMIEAEVAVERWKVDGVQVWPLFRAQVRTDNFFMYKRNAGVGPKGTEARKLRLPHVPLGPLPTIARNALGFARARLHDREAHDELRPVDAVLYSDGCSFLHLQDRYFDRFCDPVRARLAERKHSTLMVTPLGRYLQPRHAPSIFIQPRLDLAHLRGLVRGRIGGHDIELQGFDDAIRIARSAFPDVALRPRSNLVRAASYLRAFEAVHERMLDRTSPRVVFVVSYYGTEVMALVRACRRRGITTVDLQHGCINESHWAYAHWSRLPSGGFELLPRYFWVWSETEAETIRAWSQHSGGAHTPLVGGNLFLAGWRDGSSPLVGPIDERFQALKRRAPRDLAHVMYTTNGFESDAELEALAEAIGRSAERLYWWVRLHPASPHSREKIERALAASGGYYRVDPATELPLYGVLRRMAAHVTEASTTVIEAAELGVPTVLLSRSESVMYQDLIDRGWAVVLREGEDLADAVCGVLGRTGAPARDANSPDPLDVVLA